MRRSPGKSVGQCFEDGLAIDEAVREGVRRAIRRHRESGASMAVWENGRVVWVPAEELQRELEESRAGLKKPTPR